MRYGLKWPEYAKEWDRMREREGRVAEFQHDARRIVGHKERYQAVEAKTGVPWPLIGVLHLREADLDFSTYLGNGDPLNRPTRHVPRGRGPFNTWEEGAIDALKLDGLTNVKDWRLEKMLYYAELFNGAGYDMRDLPSPYIWGGTNIQRPGKYVADGRFNPRVWDGQPGVSPILSEIAKLDPNVQYVRED